MVDMRVLKATNYPLNNSFIVGNFVFEIFFLLTVFFRIGPKKHVFFRVSVPFVKEAVTILPFRAPK